jgi:outer membrane receptor protein involved in Fe transport
MIKPRCTGYLRIIDESGEDYFYPRQRLSEFAHRSSAAWFSPAHTYEVSLWGKNLADKAWIAHVYTIANEVFGVYGAPRTYGVRFDWHFAP